MSLIDSDTMNAVIELDNQKKKRGRPTKAKKPEPVPPAAPAAVAVVSKPKRGRKPKVAPVPVVEEMPQEPPKLERANAVVSGAKERKQSEWSQVIQQFKKIPKKGSDEYLQMMKAYNLLKNKQQKIALSPN